MRHTLYREDTMRNPQKRKQRLAMFTHNIPSSRVMMLGPVRAYWDLNHTQTQDSRIFILPVVETACLVYSIATTSELVERATCRVSR